MTKNLKKYKYDMFRFRKQSNVYKIALKGFVKVKTAEFLERTRMEDL